jgi:hypothetical protein
LFVHVYVHDEDDDQVDGGFSRDRTFSLRKDLSSMTLHVALASNRVPVDPNSDIPIRGIIVIPPSILPGHMYALVTPSPMEENSFLPF